MGGGEGFWREIVLHTLYLASRVLVFAEVKHLLVGLQQVGHQVEVGQAHALHPAVDSLNSLRVWSDEALNIS